MIKQTHQMPYVFYKKIFCKNSDNLSISSQTEMNKSLKQAWGWKGINMNVKLIRHEKEMTDKSALYWWWVYFDCETCVIFDCKN